MPWAGVISAAALALPCAGLADSLTVNIWPGTDPDHAIYCTLSLSEGRFTAIQAKGLGLLTPHPLRWWANKAERDAFVTGIQALISGDIPSVSPLLSPRPDPPFLTVTWLTNLDGKITSGRYTGTTLPAQITLLLNRIMPGNSCIPGALH